jgi:hypothetical protein
MIATSSGNPNWKMTFVPEKDRTYVWIDVAEVAIGEED